MKSSFGKPFHYLMRPIQIVRVIHSIAEAHAMHSSAYSGKDAIFRILNGNAGGRNSRDLCGSMEVHRGIRFTDAAHIVCAHEPGEVVANPESIDDNLNPFFRRRRYDGKCHS